LVADDRVIVPRGTSFFGHVTQSKPSGTIQGPGSGCTQARFLRAERTDQ
jgi:hypothetical protein